MSLSYSTIFPVLSLSLLFLISPRGLRKLFFYTVSPKLNFDVPKKLCLFYFMGHLSFCGLTICKVSEELYTQTYTHKKHLALCWKLFSFYQIRFHAENLLIWLFDLITTGHRDLLIVNYMWHQVENMEQPI